jgi:hypothetical protein
MSDVVATSAPESSAPETSKAPAAVSAAAPAGGHQSPIEKELAGNKEPKADSEPKVAPKAPADKPEMTAAEKAKYKLKVNGKEQEYDIDTILRKAQLSEAAETKFQEAANSRKQTEQFLQMLKSDPMSVLTHPDLGLNFEELATNFLGDKIRRDMMDPVERELEELRQYKKSQEETRQQQQQRQAKEAEEREFTQMRQQAAQEYDRKISEVLSKSQLPKTEYSVKRVAELLYTAGQKGYDLDVNTAVDMVKERYMSDIQALFGSLEGDGLLGLLGGDLAKKIRKHDIEKLKSKLNPMAQQPAAQIEQALGQKPAESRSKPSQEKLSPDEWREMIRKKAGL